MCTHYFSDDMLWWDFKQEWKNNRSLAFQPISNDCKYRSHSASTVLIQQVPFFGLYFDEQVPSLQIRITVLFSADQQTPRTTLPGFPTTLPVFRNVSTHFLLPLCTLSRCLVHAMPPESTKIEHLPRDASAILREQYLAGTFSVVTPCYRHGNLSDGS